MLSSTGVADDVAIASAFGCHRNTVGRLKRLASGGVAALFAARPGPKGPHKVTPEVIDLVRYQADQLNVPTLVRLVKERTGVSLSQSHVRRLAHHHRPATVELQLFGGSTDDHPGGRGMQQCEAERDDAEVRFPLASGALVEPELRDDRAFEANGFDPPAALPEHTRGRCMGLALYFPAIKALGLVDAARQGFSLPRSVIFGVRAVTLSLLFMALLGKPTVESAKHLRRAEFGALVGTDRAPCVKTLRRKLEAMVAQLHSADFGRRLARCWVEAGIIATGYLYVDGHMKSYSASAPCSSSTAPSAASRCPACTPTSSATRTAGRCCT